MATLLSDMGFHPLDSNGDIMPSGSVTVNNYSDGTPAVTYQDSAATVQNPYVVPLSESGFAKIYLAGGTYEIILKDSDDTIIRTIPKFTPFEGNNGGTNYGNKEEFVATVGQANFTSSDVPIGTVSVHINGLMLDTTLYSVSGNVITFTPVLNAGDQVIYEYSSEALGGSSSGAGTLWSSTTSYGIGVIVSYNSKAYVATSGSTNKRPDLEPTFWDISEGGAAWNATKNYTTGNIISYSGILYIALASSLNKQPDTETLYWKKVLGADHIMIVCDERDANTHGGSFTSGGWITRDLNKEVINRIDGANLFQNHVTLQAGTYEYEAEGVAGTVRAHQLQLFSSSGTIVEEIGLSQFSNYPSSSHSIATIKGVITLIEETSLILRHRCETTQDLFGFGYAVSWGKNVYATLKIKKIV